MQNTLSLQYIIKFTWGTMESDACAFKIFFSPKTFHTLTFDPSLHLAWPGWWKRKLGIEQTVSLAAICTQLIMDRPSQRTSCQAELQL
jgi:hypothetical protein